MPPVPKAAKKPTDHLKAEAEALDAEGYANWDFAGASFRVLPFLDWDKSAMTAVNRLDINGWAIGAVHNDDAARFVAAKATMRETLAFIREVTAHAGADTGEFFAS